MGSIGDAFDNVMAESFPLNYRRAWHTRHGLEMEVSSFRGLLQPPAAPLPTGQPQPRLLRTTAHDTDRGVRLTGVTSRIGQRLLAMTAAIWHNQATAQPATRSLNAYDH
jgi:hypothetical protein